MADPGWYADPSGLHDRRYWDGARWTEHAEDHDHDRAVAGPIETDQGHWDGPVYRPWPDDAGPNGPGGPSDAEERMRLVGAGTRGTPAGGNTPAWFEPGLEAPDTDWSDEQWSGGAETDWSDEQWNGGTGTEWADEHWTHLDETDQHREELTGAREYRPEPVAEAAGYGVAPFSPRDFSGELPIMSMDEPAAVRGPATVLAERIGLSLLAALGAAVQSAALATVLGAGATTAGSIGAGIAGLGLVGSVSATARSRGAARTALRSGPIEPGRSAPEAWLAETTTELAAATGIRPPAVEIFLSETVDQVAAAPSRNRGVLALSTGAVRELNGHEVRGLLAYGVARIARGDAVSASLVSGVGDTLVTTPSRIVATSVERVLGRGGAGTGRALELALQLTIGLLAQVVGAVDARRRVGRIDGHAASLVGNDSVVSALIVIRDDPVESELPRRQAAMAVRPSGIRAVLERLLATHPDISLRIATLE